MRRLPRVENNWNALLQTLEGHSDWVNAVAFSRDGRTLASGSWDKTIKLWEAGSGKLLQTLEVGATVTTLSFSDDGAYVLTDRGSLPITLPYSSRKTISQSPIPSCVFVRDPWVLINDNRMLWLPTDYRNAESVVYGNVIGPGCASGRVTLMELAL